MAEPIAITGIGHVSALGGDTEALARALVEGRCGIGPLTIFGHRGRAGIAAEVGVIPRLVLGLDPATVRRLSRSDRLALAAVSEAVGMAGLDVERRQTTAVCVGATTAGMLETEAAYRQWRERGTPWARLSRFVGMPLSTVGAAIAQGLGCMGPRVTTSTACSSGALAIVAAARMVARGEAPVAVAVGVDALCRLTYAGFDALQALDAEPCRPFDAARRGLSLGEGAGAVVVERADHARARGARPLALLLGSGVTADAHHVTAPHPDGAGALGALRAALAAADVAPQAIEYVNAHGSGTKHNDEVEVATLRTVLGSRTARVPISSSKSQIGHCLAAAGALEAVITVTALVRGVLPATVTLRTPEAAWADLDLVPAAGRRAALGVAVTSSYGFGGHNVTLVLARPEGRT